MQRKLIQHYAVLILVLCCYAAHAQVDLTDGFVMLEQGEFSEAKDFFEPLYDEYHLSDKTVSICYGRAIGLSGQPSVANSIFRELDITYPNDMEVKLNLSESWLWMGLPVQGIAAYQDILQFDSTLFPALLGLANAQASNGMYKEALASVNRALTVDSTSSVAHTSRKYILLGLSADLRKMSRPDAAMLCIDSILTKTPMDPDGLIAKAETYMTKGEFKAAFNTYRMSRGIIDDTKAFSGMAYTSLVLGNMSAAKRWGEKALQSATIASDTAMIVHTGVLLSDILGASGQFNKAFTLLDSTQIRCASSVKIDLARARLHSWNKEFKTAEKQFSNIILQDSLVAEAYLGLADHYYAFGMNMDATDLLSEGLKHNPSRGDLNQMMSRIQAESSGNLSWTTSGMSDNGGNRNFGSSVEYNFGSLNAWRPVVSTGWKRMTSEVSDDVVDVLSLGVSSTFQLTPNVSMSGGLTAQSFNTQSASDLRLRYILESSYLLRGNHTISLGVAGDYEEYSAQLILENIQRTTARSKYQYWNARGFGIFAQAEHSWQSDGNTRKIAFVSAYALPLRSPLLKVGINFSYLGYQFSRPEVYYSPTSQTAYEAFVELKNSPGSQSRLTYRMQLALGRQSSDLAPAQYTARCLGEIGYGWSKLSVSLYGVYGNIANDAINGYTSYEAGVRFNYRFYQGL